MTEITKKQLARSLVLTGPIYIYLDPCTEGVEIPPRLYLKQTVKLVLGLDLPEQIPDLLINDNGIFGTLSFDGVFMYVKVPWEAVFAISGTNGRGKAWYEDMPEALRIQLAQEAAAIREAELRKTAAAYTKDKVVNLSLYRQARGIA